MNKEHIIDEAYENYLENCLDIKWMKENFFYDGNSNHHVYRIIKEEFINKCKTDSKFSEKWGLKIEERELSLDEQLLLLNKKLNRDLLKRSGKTWNIISDELKQPLLNALRYNSISTKLIRLTYNDKTIESYE